MVDKDLLATKLADLYDRIERVRDHLPATAEQLQANRDALDIVSFNLLLCVQICADIAAHLIADEGWPAATSLAQSFTRLEEQSVVTASTAEALKKAVGFRNVVAHGYSRLDVAAAHRAGMDGLADLGAFAREVAAWASTR